MWWEQGNMMVTNIFNMNTLYCIILKINYNLFSFVEPNTGWFRYIHAIIYGLWYNTWYCLKTDIMLWEYWTFLIWTIHQKLSNIIEEKRKQNMWKPNTVRTYLNSYKIFLNYLSTMGAIGNSYPNVNQEIYY